jgi:hypothetical protein
MSGGINLLPLYAFMVYKGTALPFQYFSLLLHCVMTVKFRADLMQQMNDICLLYILLFYSVASDFPRHYLRKVSEFLL